MTIGKTEAITSLGYSFYGSEDVGFTFYDQSGNPIDNPPTDSEIDAEVIRLRNEWTAQEYGRKRKAEYPSIEECVHAILDDDLTALQEKRQAVKTKYSKG